MFPDPKPYTYRSEDYLAFIRTKPCLICGMPAIAAHQPMKMGGMSKKGHDSTAVPLCPKHHNGGGVGESEHRGQKTFWDKHNIDIQREIIKLLTEYLHVKGV